MPLTGWFLPRPSPRPSDGESTDFRTRIPALGSGTSDAFRVSVDILGASTLRRQARDERFGFSCRRFVRPRHAGAHGGFAAAEHVTVVPQPGVVAQPGVVYVQPGSRAEVGDRRASADSGDAGASNRDGRSRAEHGRGSSTQPVQHGVRPADHARGTDQGERGPRKHDLREPDRSRPGAGVIHHTGSVKVNAPSGEIVGSDVATSVIYADAIAANSVLADNIYVRDLEMSPAKFVIVPLQGGTIVRRQSP